MPGALLQKCERPGFYFGSVLLNTSSSLRNQLFEILKMMLTLLVALLMGALVMQLSGKNSLQAYSALFSSALGDSSAIGTALAATPLIFTGLAAAIAFRAGVFNVGVEGSLYRVPSRLPGWVYFHQSVRMVAHSFVYFGCSSGGRSLVVYSRCNERAPGCR